MSLQRPELRSLGWIDRCFKPPVQSAREHQRGRRTAALSTRSTSAHSGDRHMSFRQLEAAFMEHLGSDSSGSERWGCADVAPVADQNPGATGSSATSGARNVHFGSAVAGSPFEEIHAAPLQSRVTPHIFAPVDTRASTGSGWITLGALDEALSLPDTVLDAALDTTAARPSADAGDRPAAIGPVAHNAGESLALQPAETTHMAASLFRKAQRRAQRSFHHAISVTHTPRSATRASAARSRCGVAAKQAAQLGAAEQGGSAVSPQLQRQSDSSSAASARIPSSRGELLTGGDGLPDEDCVFPNCELLQRKLPEPRALARLNRRSKTACKACSHVRPAHPQPPVRCMCLMHT